MNVGIIFDLVFIIGFAYFVFVPFGAKRLRAPWAKVVFIVCGLVGTIKGPVGLGLDMNWLVVSNSAGSVLDKALTQIGGLLLGFMLSLIFSGQLLGTKAAPNDDHAPLV